MNSEANILVRPATPGDVGDVWRLIRGLAVYEKLEHLYTSTEEKLREALFGPRPLGEAVLATVEGEAAGAAVFYPTFSTFATRPGLYLEDIFVDPRFRGLGVGKRLMAHLAAVAVERGCYRIEWVALDWNEPAIGFYRKLGAKALDEWTSFRLSGEALEHMAREGGADGWESRRSDG